MNVLAYMLDTSKRDLGEGYRIRVVVFACDVNSRPWSGRMRRATIPSRRDRRAEKCSKQPEIADGESLPGMRACVCLWGLNPDLSTCQRRRSESSKVHHTDPALFMVIGVCHFDFFSPCLICCPPSCAVGPNFSLAASESGLGMRRVPS